MVGGETSAGVQYIRESCLGRAPCMRLALTSFAHLRTGRSSSNIREQWQHEHLFRQQVSSSRIETECAQQAPLSL